MALIAGVNTVTSGVWYFMVFHFLSLEIYLAFPVLIHSGSFVHHPIVARVEQGLVRSSLNGVDRRRQYGQFWSFVFHGFSPPFVRDLLSFPSLDILRFLRSSSHRRSSGTGGLFGVAWMALIAGVDTVSSGISYFMVFHLRSFFVEVYVHS